MSKHARIITFATALVLAAPLVAWSTPACCETADVHIDDQSAAQSLIQTVTREIQEEMRTRAIAPNDTARIMEIVNRNILPYTDLRRTTRLAMGPSWKKTTPEQQDAITKQFEQLLIHTYSGALGLVTPNLEFRYPPSHGPADATDTVVKTVAVYNGEPVEINYRLYRSPTGWRVYDLNVMGVWLVQIYRHQFNEIIQQKGVDGLIQALAEQNKRLAVSPRSWQ
ncbi:toluene tolerance protein [Burkholderia ubonensis]|uniref:MlaC/ttg2D family ABC transporter substrate-binding protein n=1 Tax=Burkholderia ubonensis TaxID=101571 RepID=UPI0007557D3C|nr:ABC transporter substrate-binding protein [Burkholderia ubonensis]KVO56040.1 toluene tolerance protein [Burkholderia ubonensis]KVP93068.1 toluene tolerance protein [Burkholderia ubonensis]KVQ13539.1 toluene tolerance protein [Burkholderia ubonensis]KWC12496.1 toluene tolerance protein [Burkholderia ubonensis]OJB46570.1 toluene tolerance protein [Burkholderia ubonensis]